MVIHRLSIDRYFLPESEREATRLLEQASGRYFPIGGGTGFAFSKPKNLRGIVDLSRAGLDYVKKRKNGIHIGAATPIRTLMDSPALAGYCGGVLPEAALTIATTPLRNMITVGGNAIQVYYWSSLPPLLLALKARFVIAGKKKRTMPAESFYSKQPRRHLDRAEILREILLPPGQKGVAGAFLKFSKTDTDFALVNVAAVIRAEGGICRDASIVLGAVSPLPIRLQKAEKILKGSSLSKEIIEKAAAEGIESVKIMRDFRVSPGYKKKIIPTLVERSLSLASDRCLGDV